MGRSKRFVACFTGHRPGAFGSYDESDSAQKIVRAELRREIDRLIATHKEIEFIVGGALGVDTWAAMEVLGARGWTPSGDKVSITLAVPCIGQQNLWPALDQYRYMGIFRAVDHIHWCDHGDYAPWKMMVRNKWMVDQSDLVIAVWNGAEKGGTTQCVKYATKHLKPITNLWPDIEKKL